MNKLTLLQETQYKNKKEYEQEAEAFIRMIRGFVPIGSNRVNRGGSWNNSAGNCRSANRNKNNGFRLAPPQLTRSADTDLLTNERNPAP